MKAWGPDPDPTLRASATLEFVVYNRVGGQGSMCFDELTFSELAPADGSPLDVAAMATAGDAALAVDGEVATSWRAPAIAGGQRLVLDLGSVREFGGLVLDWLPGAHASRYGSSFRRRRRVAKRPQGGRGQCVRD